MSRASNPGDRLLNGSTSIDMPGTILRPVSDELPAWLLVVPGVGSLAEQIGVTEFRRRLLHMLPGLFPCLLWIIPHQDPWGPLLINLTLMFSVGIVTYAILNARVFARPGEEQWARAVAGYVVPVLGMLFLLPGRSELGLMTLGIMALGDGSAALGGIAWGRRRLPWNPRKTWMGILCFAGAATVMSTLYYWMEARPGVPLGMALVIAGVAALTAAVVESLPIRSHDNLRVGITAGLTGLFMHVMLLGW
jgi:dolichol kinase